jgi:ABC-type branched-subunit amino acid transport system ATPase component
VLEIDQLSVSFGGVRAVDGVSFRMPEAGTVGLVGPNGSGKTTLVNALTGMVPAIGHVAVGGARLRLGRPGDSYRLGIVRTYQTPRVFASLTCLENIVLAMSPRNGTGLTGAVLRRPAMLRAERERWRRGRELLDRVGLGALTDVAAGELAYGRQRVLELARGLAASPRLILLDEPAAGLNQAETDELADIIAGVQADGIGVLLIEHKIDFVTRLCPTIVVLELGHKIAEGAPAEVFADQRVMDAYLGAVHDA